jgi:tetratricopeptide (TPR) repeat protein
MKRIAAILCIATIPLIAGAQTNDAQALYQLGRDAITRGEPGRAAEYFEKAVALEPNNADYHYRLANAYGLATASVGMFKAMSLGKKMKAELQRTVQLDPNYIPARFGLLEFYVSAPAIAGGSESAAMEEATEIRKRDAMEGHRAFARIHAAAKRLDLARKEYAEMLKEQPVSARAHYFLGVYLMLTEKNYEAASDELESAVRLDPSYMSAYFQIGRLAVLGGSNFVRGEEKLKRYLGYRPKDEEPSVARAYYWLGGIYEKQGRKAEAKSNYAESLRINPNQKDVAAAIKRVS